MACSHFDQPRRLINIENQMPIRCAGLADKVAELDELAQSQDRRHKERAMRRRQLKWLWKRLKEIQGMKFTKKTDMAMKLGAARQQERHDP